MSENIDVVVIGSGPGGYTAAFRAADLGQKVILVEKYNTLGGVCLNVGCIPSKALLHAAQVVDDVKYMDNNGISFGKPEINKSKLIIWKNSIIKKLTSGLNMLVSKRKVKVIKGIAKFIDNKTLLIVDGEKETKVSFKNAIIATGSTPIRLPFIPEDQRIFDSTGALELEPKKDLLIIGGGIIGCEMATIYSRLGIKVTIIELSSQLLPGADPDLVKPLQNSLIKHCEIMFNHKVVNINNKGKLLVVTVEDNDKKTKNISVNNVLVSVGRTPNTNINLSKAGVDLDAHGFIKVDKQMRTSSDNIFAIGDVVGNPMLAHKAIPQGKVAAEVISGHKHCFEPRAIASVAYTHPEVAWVGITESEAKKDGLEYRAGVFPWAANGRSLTHGYDQGITKLLFDIKSNTIIGAGIVGPNAGDLISEAALAIEMACDAEDIALTIHPHPTFAETIAQSAEVFEGTVTDLYIPKN